MPDDTKPSARIIEAVAIAVISGVIAAAATSVISSNTTAVQVAGLSSDFADFKGEIRGELKDLKAVIYRPSWDREATPRATPRRPIADSRAGAGETDHDLQK